MITKSPPRNIIINELVKQSVVNKFDAYWMLHTSGLVPD